MMHHGVFSWRRLLAVGLAAIMLSASTPALADNQSSCNRAIGKSVSLLRKAHQKRISKCLRFANYDCPPGSLAIQQAENRLRARIADEGSTCVAAVDGEAVPVSSFGPSSCPAAWNGCDVLVPSITTLDDLADCLVCVQVGYDLKVRDDIDFPPAVDDVGTRMCVRGLYEAMAQAVRVGLHAVDSCTADTGAQPFACPVDPSPETNYGGLLEKIDRLADHCDDDGPLDPQIATMCNGTATSAQNLATCFGGLTRCLACKAANSTWDQGEDCAAAAAGWECLD